MSEPIWLDVDEVIDMHAEQVSRVELNCSQGH